MAVCVLLQRLERGCMLEVVCGGVFFFKQKTAYEMLRSLVGSEMCIRDRPRAAQGGQAVHDGRGGVRARRLPGDVPDGPTRGAVSYTHLTLPTIYSV